MDLKHDYVQDRFIPKKVEFARKIIQVSCGDRYLVFLDDLGPAMWILPILLLE